MCWCTRCYRGARSVQTRACLWTLPWLCWDGAQQVACFPFDDHNCPPLHLILAFCQSALSWLRSGMDHVVVVHCKAGMGRTGIMIASLLLFLNVSPSSAPAGSLWFLLTAPIDHAFKAAPDCCFATWWMGFECLCRSADTL